MSLTLEQLTRRTQDLAPHPTGANYQTTRRIVRLTLAALAEHFAATERHSTFGDPGHGQAIHELLDVCRPALAGIQGETARRRRSTPPRTCVGSHGGIDMEEITTRSDMERSYAAGRQPINGSIVRADPPPPRIDLPRYDGLKECVRCGGLCHREHVAVDDSREAGFCITLVYCAHCDVGFEILWSAHTEGWELDVRAIHEGPKLRLFLRRLEDLQCVAA